MNASLIAAVASSVRIATEHSRFQREMEAAPAGWRHGGYKRLRDDPLVQQALAAEDAAFVAQAIADEDAAFECWIAAEGTATFQEWQESRPRATVRIRGGRPSEVWAMMLPGRITYLDETR